MKLNIKNIILFICCFHLFDNYLIGQNIIEDKGKYGIVDKNGKIILHPIYETVKYYPYRLEDFFLVRQNYKYAYVYKVTYSYDTKVQQKLANPYWVISDFEYDALDPLFNFNKKLGTELFMKYKKDGMYGLIYIESSAEDHSMMFTEMYNLSLGKNTVYPPIYNQIFFSDNSIFPVQKNDKFGFIFAKKSDCADSFYVNNTEIKYDEIPRHISYNTDERAYTIRIKENQKYGLLTFDYDGCKPKYQIPCECKTEIKQLYSKDLFVCEKTEANTMVVYNEAEKKRFELPAIEKEEMKFEIINRLKNGNQYILVYSTNYKKANKEIDQLERLEDVYIIDIKNKKMKHSFLGNKNVSFEMYYKANNQDVILMRKTKTDIGFSYDFFDIETGLTLFSIPPSKKGCHYYYFDTDYKCNNLRVMCLKKNVGCYDFETKTYTKGKCKEC